jgi:hypothetical protein
MMVVLFIDLDGVAHPVGASRIDDAGQLVGEDLFCWWPQLRAVLDEYPQVRVVVHSSWRWGWPGLQWLRPLLPADLASRVADITDPQVMGRHASIERYLQDHPEVAGHVILDDEKPAFPEWAPLVLCDPQRGLSDPAKVGELREALAAAAGRP